MDQSSDICSQWKSLDFAFKSVDFEKNLEKVIEELQNQPARNDVVSAFSAFSFVRFQ
jgi:hypothetical protein